MRKKLTEEQKYNRKWYRDHKDDADFRKRRREYAKKYRTTAKYRKRRNAKLRERWASDPDFRKKMSAYQKAYHQRRKLAAMQTAFRKPKAKSSSGKKGARG